MSQTLILQNFFSIKSLLLAEILMKYTDPKYQNDVIKMVGDYCGKPVSNYTEDPIKTQMTWSFYHAFFFAFTVCSTVGKKSRIQAA